MATAPELWDARSERREEVFHRTRATTADGTPLRVTLVDLSSGGCMARCEAAVAPGDRLAVELPLAGRIQAEVRWALGGRLGCRFERALGADTYAQVLARMRG